MSNLQGWIHCYDADRSERPCIEPTRQEYVWPMFPEHPGLIAVIIISIRLVCCCDIFSNKWGRIWKFNAGYIDYITLSSLPSSCVLFRVNLIWICLHCEEACISSTWTEHIHLKFFRSRMTTYKRWSVPLCINPMMVVKINQGYIHVPY